MARYDRDDLDDVRVFDGAEDEEEAEGARLPLLIVISLLLLVALAGVVWIAYMQGVARGHAEGPRIVAANGPDTAATGTKPYQQPAPPDDQIDQGSSMALPSADIAPPVPVAKMAPPPKITQSGVPDNMPAPPVKPPAAKVAAAEPAPATAPPAKLAPATKPTATRPVAEKPAAAKMEAPAAATSGAYRLQIGAYKSLADAEAAWRTYRAKHASLLAGQNHDVLEVNLGDKGIWYRLRIDGFAQKDAATGLCDRLKAEGGACFLAR